MRVERVDDDAQEREAAVVARAGARPRADVCVAVHVVQLAEALLAAWTEGHIHVQNPQADAMHGLHC